MSAQKKGAQSERYRLTAMLRDPLTQVKVAALSGKLIAEWRDKRLKQVSGSTTNRDLNLISHVINVARKEWGIHIDNPVSMIRRPADNRGRNRLQAPPPWQWPSPRHDASERCRTQRATFGVSVNSSSGNALRQIHPKWAMSAME